MTDFLPFLYKNYIKPYLDTCPTEGYEMPLAIMECDLDPVQLTHYARAAEFLSTRAFLLGLRTGAGLSRQLT